MRYYFLIVICLFSSIIPCFSQPYYSTLRVDSLKINLRSATDTQRVNTLNRLSNKYLYPVRTQNIIDSSQSNAQYYTDEALRLAIKLNYTKGIGNAYLNQANLYINKENFKKALLYLRMAMPMLRQSNDQYAKANCLESTGFCIHALGDNKTAILYYDSLRAYLSK